MVAIIAILATIAVPNFLEAQVRAKVSRGHNDMRAIATALESYKIDTNLYPPDRQFYQAMWGLGGTEDDRFADCVLGRLTTPIAYMTSLPRNVFQYSGGAFDGDPMWYMYKSKQNWGSIVGPGILAVNPEATDQYEWIMLSVGPDQFPSFGEYALFGEAFFINMPPFNSPDWGNGPAFYDPTNGTISIGDLVRLGP